jgi:hypothetical protein
LTKKFSLAIPFNLGYNMSMIERVLSNRVVKVQADTSLIRDESFMGVAYKVVPVVALVEGVLQGANSTAPELALAAEFGKIPEGWNYRPLVHDHPQINGIFVSAGSPGILEDWSLGFTFNAQVEDNKLKIEAWINPLRAEELGESAQNTYNKLLAGEMVEVSVGCFTDVIPSKGIHVQNGAKKAYEGVWVNVVPDHLAILSEGKTGACSVEAGCGANRVNMGSVTNTVDTVPVILFNRTLEPTVACANACTCGGNTMSEDPAAIVAQEREETAQRIAALEFTHRVAEISPEVTFDNAYNIIHTALREKFPASYPWIVALTTEQVVFEHYVEGSGYSYMALNYSLSSEGSVEFTGEPAPVNIITKIVPRINEYDVPSGDVLNQIEEDSQMAEETGSAGTPSAEGGITPTSVEGASATQPAVQTVQVNRPVTVEQYLAGAPAEIRTVLEGGLRLHTQHKNSLIKGLMDSKRCRFSEEQLQSYSTEELEAMAELANVTTFEGRGVPLSTPAFNTQSAEGLIPEAPKAFEAGAGSNSVGGVIARRAA